jgi:hypothetical protein
MLGALIPFLLLCLYGLDWLLGRWQKPWLRPAVLTGLILFMLAMEFRDDQPAFASEYNWFHLQNVPAQSEAHGAATPQAGQSTPK